MKAIPYDIAQRAANGLRRGRTTGTCAAAAVKAAAYYLVSGEVFETVEVGLPGDTYFLPVPIKSIERMADGGVRAAVIKEAGDDPDQTDGAVIFAVLRANGTDQVKFLAGEGVGTVTEPGIRVAVGEPAINPVPRAMILKSIGDVLEENQKQAPHNTLINATGFDIEIGCEKGEEIAKRTFNPRLGIKGGISILGTTGIVEPMSLAAYQASIEVYIRVAVAELGKVAYMPGNIGITFAKEELGISGKKLVHISNFIGFALDYTSDYLEELDAELDELWLLGHPGKLAKILDNVWDTHSSKSTLATGVISRMAARLGFNEELVSAFENANTVEAIVEQLQGESQLANRLWTFVEAEITRKAATRLQRVKNLSVRLFDMSGRRLTDAGQDLGDIGEQDNSEANDD